MKKKTDLRKRFSWILAAVLIGFLPLASAVAQEDAPAEEEGLPAERIEPVFPAANTNLVFVEGEDAVSTNFTKEPILNYAASGSRTLQLNRTTDLQGGAAFFADFVFYVEEPGAYELWYGGTPPGPREELYPAYASPIRLSFDGEEAADVYREDVTVAGQYTPVYYWNLAGERDLEAGRHTLRFLVAEKRNYDGRYFFYLDCFFLVRKSEGRRLADDPLPAVFPADLSDRSMDYPFRAVEDYQIVIRDNPQDVDAHVKLSYIYSLVGDYLNALKYLRRAVAMDPTNPDLLLLQAKNQIWKGDVQAGLDDFWDLLLLDPDREDRWMEAGKVAAWTGRYDESIAFFKAGLERFPGSMQLLVNIGLTYLWSGRQRDAEERFDEARELVGDDAARLIDLAEVFRINGYPDRAADLYMESIRRHPEYLEAYLLLEESYFRKEQMGKFDATAARIEATFVPSERLSQTLDLFGEKMGMKLAVMAGYEEKLAENPDNLALREILAQTYFWNGYRRRGIDEYLNILLNHSFRSIKRFTEDSGSLLELYDKSHVYRSLFEDQPSKAQGAATALEAAYSGYQAALKSLESFLAKVEEARNKGEELPVPEGEDPADVVDNAAEALSVSYREARDLLEAYETLSAAFEAEYVSPGGALADLQQKEAAEEEAFQNVIRVNRWRWDTIAFDAEVTAMGDQLLARYILARTALLDGKLPTAERSFVLEDLSSPLAADFQYGLFQAKLWQGRTEEAFALLQESPVDLASAVPYLERLQSLSRSLQREAAQMPIEADEAQIERILADMAEARKSAVDRQKRVEEIRRSILNLVRDRLQRAVYHLQEETYLTRRELGDYYLADEDLEAAIAQFRQVLAVDPWDLGTVYRLGNVYEWSGDWRQAMKNYERIYYQDPLYENAAALYNRLSREHSDTAAFSTHTVADTSRIAFHAEASLSHPMGTYMGWRLLYESDANRIYKPPAGEDSSVYRVQTLTFGLPLSLTAVNPDTWFRKLSMEPKAGVAFRNDLLSDADGLAAEIPLTQFLGNGRIEPVLSVAASLNLGSHLTLGGEYRYERQEETYSPERTAVHVHSGELSAGTDLSFIDIYPFRSSTMRTYGKLAFLTDGNLLLDGLQEFTFGLLNLDSPAVILQLIGSVLYQNSLLDIEKNYYAPRGVLVAGGGLVGSTWLAVGEESGLGLSLRLSGAYFGEEIADPAARIHRAQIDAEANVEYSKGGAVYFVGTQIAATYRFTPPIVTTPWDYWSAFVRMGFSTRLPRLLAP